MSAKMRQQASMTSECVAVSSMHSQRWADSESVTQNQPTLLTGPHCLMRRCLLLHCVASHLLVRLPFYAGNSMGRSTDYNAEMSFSDGDMSGSLEFDAGGFG